MHAPKWVLTPPLLPSWTFLSLLLIFLFWLNISHSSNSHDTQMTQCFKPQKWSFYIWASKCEVFTQRIKTIERTSSNVISRPMVKREKFQVFDQNDGLTRYRKNYANCLITFKWHFHSVESIVFYLEHHQTLYEEEEAYFREAVIYNFWCPWILIYWKLFSE